MVRAIVAPTVPVGGERVRVCLHAGNSFEEVDRLVGVVGEWVRRVEAEVVEKARL
jgi:8-amino-7-oxononanoate synthase